MGGEHKQDLETMEYVPNRDAKGGDTVERLTLRDYDGRAILRPYGLRIYCSTQATVDYICKLEEALQAHEPRVLTLDEVRNNCPDCVYVETKTGWLECAIQDHGESDKYDGFFVYGIDEYFMESWDIYGKWWRCWSAKPSDAERKAVAWGD